MKERSVDVTDIPSPTRLPPAKLRALFTGLLLAMLLAALDSTIVATALPTIVAELGNVERLSWVVTSYLLSQTIVIPLYGKLGDLYGRRIVLQVAIVIFVLGSALSALPVKPRAFTGDGLSGIIEAYGRTALQIEDLDVRIELRKPGEDTAIKFMDADLLEPKDDGGGCCNIGHGGAVWAHAGLSLFVLGLVVRRRRRRRDRL